MTTGLTDDRSKNPRCEKNPRTTPENGSLNGFLYGSLLPLTLLFFLKVSLSVPKRYIFAERKSKENE